MTTPILAILSKFEVVPENLVNYKMIQENAQVQLPKKTLDSYNFLGNEVCESLCHLTEVSFLYTHL